MPLSTAIMCCSASLAWLTQVCLLKTPCAVAAVERASCEG